VTLERQGDWLVMATTLLQLKAQLLWPATPDAAADAAAEAARRLGALDTMAQMRAAATWLAARPRLGVDVFSRGRGGPTPAPRAELYVAFLEATLVMLECRKGVGGEAPPVYRRPCAAVASVGRNRPRKAPAGRRRRGPAAGAVSAGDCARRQPCRLAPTGGDRQHADGGAGVGAGRDTHCRPKSAVRGNSVPDGIRVGDGAQGTTMIGLPGCFSVVQLHI
jgi:hypothetical protein